jgi:hypothetical protein
MTLPQATRFNVLPTALPSPIDLTAYSILYYKYTTKAIDDSCLIATIGPLLSCPCRRSLRRINPDRGCR